MRSDPESPEARRSSSAPGGPAGHGVRWHRWSATTRRTTRTLRREKIAAKTLSLLSFGMAELLQTALPVKRSPEGGLSRVRPRPRADGLEESFQFMYAARSNRRIVNPRLRRTCRRWILRGLHVRPLAVCPRRP